MPNFDDLLDGLSEEDRKACESAYEAFLEWWQANQFKPLYQEKTMVSEKHRYGGCPDLVAYDHKGRLCMIDFKTSDGVYGDYLYQLGAYRILHNETFPENPLTGGNHLCRFSKENADFHHHAFPNLDEAEKGFLLMRDLYDIDAKLKKRV